jgi:hypothetical protein
MSDIPEDVMKRAREVAEAVCLQGMSPTDCHIDAIARALMEERSAERERAKAHWLQWHQKRMEISRGFWLRAGKKALGGDLRELRNRVDLAEAEPVQLVLSEASHEA